MRKYLATLHKRSDRHKKNFALGVSGGFTLFIFAVWTFVNFGQSPAISEGDTRPQLAAANEVSPLESLGDSLASGLKALRERWSELLKGVSSLDLGSGYEEMRTKTLDTYGR